MAVFQVIYRIEVIAETHREAAEQTLKTIKEGDALFFDVLREGDLDPKSVLIDLNDEEE